MLSSPSFPKPPDILYIVLFFPLHTNSFYALSGLQINHVGPVPPSYYVRDHIKVNYEQCMTISRCSSQELDCEVLFPGSVLRFADFCSYIIKYLLSDLKVSF